MSAPVIVPPVGERPPTGHHWIGHRLVSAIAGCYLRMDPLVTEIWATPGVLTLRERSPLSWTP